MKTSEMTRDTILNFTAKTTIQRWGNSQGIRLSKEILSQMNLQERLEAFYKKPLDEIYIESTQEVDVGEPKGNEIW